MRPVPRRIPAMLETITIRPFSFLTSGKNVLVTSIKPHKLTSAFLLNSANGIHSMGPITKIPALFISPHRPEISQGKDELLLLFFFFHPLEQPSKDCQSNYTIAIATLSDWLKNLAPVFQPTSKTKTNHTLYARCFPSSGQFTGNFWEF